TATDRGNLAGNFSGVNPRFSNLQGFVDGQLATVQVEFDFLANGRIPGDLVPGPVAPPNRRFHTRYTDAAWFIQDTWKLTRRLTLTPGLRWEFYGGSSSPGHERVRDVNFYPGEGGDSYMQFANGAFQRTLEAPGKYRGHYVLPDRNNFGPRLGLAFDLTGDGKTVLRAGAGIFFDANYSRAVAALSGRVQFTNVPFTPEMLENPYAIAGQATSAAPSITRSDPEMEASYTSSWNATIERELGGKMVLSGSYVGSSGSGLLLLARENGQGSGRYVGRPGQRILPNLGYFLTGRNLAHSSYHGLQLKAEAREIRRLGLQFGANYTWGHSIDNTSARDTEGQGFSQGFLIDPSKPRLDRGNSSFDQRQRFVAHFIWKIPAGWSPPGLAKHLAAGWQLSGIVSFQTGQPFHMFDQGTPDRELNAQRPRLTGPPPRVLRATERIPDPLTPNRFLLVPANGIRNPDGSCIPNATPFACVASVHDPLDNLLPRSSYTRPGRRFQDVALTRSLQVRESVRVQLRAEFYNLFNHANLQLAPLAANNGLTLNAPAFAGGAVGGVVASYGGTPRQVVVAAKIIF
ncbi:MAG TPA: TonB-dependent receptor, partial [Bryobacteraceae bacterium]|nr:TonB-dependent receptor [Bryobacteraceae bacterium]